MQFSASRQNLSTELQAAVRASIVEGELAGGERINEVHLAKRLNVSRTPLREALNALVAEGALISIPRRGFFVRPLTVEDFTEVYTIRPILDPGALRLAGLPPKAVIAELERLNAAMIKEACPEQRIRLDDEWHLKLLEHCPNSQLIDLIKQFMARTHRYELAYFRQSNSTLTATNDHDRITDALRTADLEAACSALEQNMRSGFEPIVEWLSQQPK